MRADGDETTGPTGFSGGAPRAPQPGLGELPRLLDRVRGSGLDVVYATSGAVRPVSDVVGATVFRIVQESLTNPSGTPTPVP